MHRSPGTNNEQRDLTDQERSLVRWMIGHGPVADPFLDHLLHARVASVCDCGCASINFAIEGCAPPTGGLRIIADFLFGEGSSLCGAFVFEQDGVLAGLEVYGLACDAPKALPDPEALRPWKTG